MNACEAICATEGKTTDANWCCPSCGKQHCDHCGMAAGLAADAGPAGGDGVHIVYMRCAYCGSRLEALRRARDSLETAQEEQMLAILEEHLGGVSPKCYLWPSIPEEALERAKGRYTEFLSKKDTVLALYEEPGILHGKRGFVFTTRGFAFRASQYPHPICVTYRKLKPAQVRLHGDNKLTVREHRVPTKAISAGRVERALQELIGGG